MVYDKAKYHVETVLSWGLNEVQAEVHTAFFLGWLIDNDLTSDEFNRHSSQLIARYKSREIDALTVYEHWDCCLIDNMLSDTGNAFALAYFDFERGRYLVDYRDLLVGSLPSEFHVCYSWENYEIIRKRVDNRFQQWQRGELTQLPQPPVQRRRLQRFQVKRWMKVVGAAVLIWAFFMAAILSFLIHRPVR